MFPTSIHSLSLFPGLGGSSPKEEQKGNLATSQQQQQQSQQQHQQLLTSQAQTQAQLINSQGTAINSQGQLVNSQGQVVGQQQVFTTSGQVVTQLANHVGPNVQASVLGGQVMQNPPVMVNAAQQVGTQHLPFQQMTPAQQLQLQQMQLQHQAQHLKKMRRQDQAAALQQQLLSQGKVSPTPIRKDSPATVTSLQQLQNLQQQHLAGKMVGRVATTSLPTAALLQQSTIATSESKPRLLVMPAQGVPTSETPLSSLQR